MPNHVHLLIEVGSIPLSKAMQGLQFTYTQYFNRKYQVSLEGIVQSCCRRLKIGDEDLRQSDRGRRAADARHQIGYIAKELGGFTHGSVARKFGREPISFSVGVRRVTQRMERDPELKWKIEGLCQEIRKGKRRKY